MSQSASSASYCDIRKLLQDVYFRINTVSSAKSAGKPAEGAAEGGTPYATTISNLLTEARKPLVPAHRRFLIV